MRRTILFTIIIALGAACGTKPREEMKDSEVAETIEVRELGTDHWQTYTDIVIDAPVEEVWTVLTNWKAISTWSSSLVGVSGDIQDKGEVTVSYLVDGQTYHTTHVFIYKEMEEFGWSDPMSGSFEGLRDNHRFRVERISDSETRFIHSDDFKGRGNEEMTAEKVANMTVAFFPGFNRELKRQVEKGMRPKE